MMDRMQKTIGLLLTVLLFLACGESRQPALQLGKWHGELEVQDGGKLPFTFDLSAESGSYRLIIHNAEEEVVIDELKIWGDSIRIQMPVFEGYILGTFSESEIRGSFNKESLDRYVPFYASLGERPRFENTEPARSNISGIWETQFSPNSEDEYAAMGIFKQHENKLTGTFRTNTGDYRYLEGVVDGDSLRLSTFDGAHAFLFTAGVNDSLLQGTFYSGNHFQEPFIARRNEAFELADSDSLTYLKTGYEKLSFSFPDNSGKKIS